MLGTNDLKQRFSLPAGDIAAGVGVLADIVLKSGCGPAAGGSENNNGAGSPEVRKLTDFAEMFTGAREKSLKFPEAYAAAAEEKGVTALDIGREVRFSDADGIHFEPPQLEILGKLVAEKVKLLPI